MQYMQAGARQKACWNQTTWYGVEENTKSCGLSGEDIQDTDIQDIQTYRTYRHSGHTGHTEQGEEEN